jgi:chaperonin GroES
MIRPLTGQVLLRIVPPEARTASGIELPQHTLTPEEVQERNHHPEPPPPDVCLVEAIGPWRKTNDGKMIPPPFPPGSKVIVREGSGLKLHRDIGERLKLVHTDDILAVLQESC